MCIRDRFRVLLKNHFNENEVVGIDAELYNDSYQLVNDPEAVSYTHLRAHETVLDLVCRLLLETKKTEQPHMPSILLRTSTALI